MLQHRSKIVGEQLGPHLEQLVATGFLASYGRKAKTRGGLCRHHPAGKMFFEDYDRFYRNRGQGDLQFEFKAERREIGEPLRVAYLFAEKRTGQPVTSIAFVPSKDVETARQLLAELPFAEIEPSSATAWPRPPDQFRHPDPGRLQAVSRPYLRLTPQALSIRLL